MSLTARNSDQLNSVRAGFAVFVVFVIEILMKKCYISTLANTVSKKGKKNPEIAFCHTGLAPGRVGSKKLTRVQLWFIEQVAWRQQRVT